MRADRAFVLYWMIANRRTTWNFALERAVTAARELGKPVLVLEALRAGHRWASRRLHAFVLDGMRDNRRACEAAGVAHYAYVEPAPGEGSGLLQALAAEAALVVTDDFPCFFLPRMVAAAAARLDVRLEAVDANGLLPVRGLDHAAPSAYAFRRHLQRRLPVELARRPLAAPLAGWHPPAAAVPGAVLDRWPDMRQWLDRGGSLDRLPIDQRVAPTTLAGGSAAASSALDRFLHERLPRYADRRNHPDDEMTSGLSPYLHWGHISVHDILDRLATREGWLADLPAKSTGGREGWWGMSRPAEAFLDQVVTWRELGFNMCALRPDDYDRYESLPEWARRTLGLHADDDREHIYDLGAFERAMTHDPLWNAAARQLATEGRIHNYLRMLWGKKILEWTPSPREALAIMVALNDKYALDGRDPNSYSGIFWTLGRYDRPWGPERPVFGTIRYMSSKNTARKVRISEYLARYGGQPRLLEP